jgi:predicted transcriptional regulator
MYSSIIRKKAQQLREDGKSLLEIATTLGIAKSTTSYWLTGQENTGAFGTMNRQEWLASIRIKSLAARRANKIKHQLIIDQQARALESQLNPTLETKRAILAALYWAEGAKGTTKIVCFANTDPLLIKLFTTLFRECYELDESKFRLRLHLHRYHNEEEAITFWTDTTCIPRSNLGKIYWKKEPNSGKRYRQNFMGICFVRYNDVHILRRIIAYYKAMGEDLTRK